MSYALAPIGLLGINVNFFGLSSVTLPVVGSGAARWYICSILRNLSIN